MTHAIRLDNLIKITKENIRTSSLCLAHINARPIKNKILQFQEYSTNVNIDLCAIMETWLKPDNDDIAKAVPPLGYILLLQPRQDGQRGGGNAIVSKSYLNIEEDKDKLEHQTMELLHLSVYVNIDLCVIMETWLKPDNDDIAKAVPPLGYTLLSQPRQDGQRGGINAIVSKSYLNIEEDKDKLEHQTMVLLHLSVKVKSLVLSLYTVYRIPNTSILTFCNKMANVLENNIVSDRGETILIGDFNIHMDDPVDTDTTTFNDFLDSLDLTNLVNFGAHTSNHTLDLVIQSNSFRVNSKTLQGHFLFGSCFHTSHTQS